MSKTYDNTNSGALFKNQKKSSEKHPDYTGSVNVGGVEYWLSSWIKKSKTGDTFMSLAVTPKDKDAKQTEKAKPVSKEELDDTIPF
jgi:uncharacterized protein (DUF736 family)